MFATPATPQVCAGSSGNPSVKVYVRIRPLLQQECNLGAKNVLEVSPADKQIVVVEDGGEKIFKYDDVFEEYCSQEEIYTKAVEPLVTKVEEGHNATVFAYGQTGSGKTFTMGTDPCFAKEDEGILQRALHAFLGNDENKLPVDDLENISSRASRTVTISIIEVYNEMIFDLLASSRIPLKSKPGPRGAVSAVGMVEEKVESIEEGLLLLEKGSHLRSVGATAMNQHSSRSHALIYLTLKHGKHHGCLRLVDLAGAEGVGRAQTSGQQFTEGVNINKGLLTLGKVLAALSNPAGGYVPFRDSILTRLLKDSLGGTSYTAMIACVNPANFNMYETINTLRYAEQTRSIRTKPHALSTVKRSGVKRRFEDVSATPGVWKKQVMASGKRQKHNSTISTPGHKPAVKSFVPTFNNTFVTPSNRMSEVQSNSMLKNEFSLPLAAPMFSTLSQPIFEDDSPSRLSTVSAVDDTESHPSTFSPYVDRVTDHLEQSMMARLEIIEDRMADKVISRLTHMKRGKLSRMNRKMKRQSKSKSSTPTTNEDCQSSAVSDSSDDNILGTTILNALFSKVDMKSMFQDVISSAMESLPNNAHSKSIRRSIIPPNLPSRVPSENNPVRNPLGDLTNTQKRGDMTVLKNHRPLSSSLKEAGHMYNLPLTSTAFAEVRRSTRLSTNSDIRKSLFNDLSPEMNSNVCSSFMVAHEELNAAIDTSDDNSCCFSHDTTAILKNEAQLQSENVFSDLSMCSSKSTVTSRRRAVKSKHLEYLEDTNSQTCRSPVDVGHSLTFDIPSKTLEPDQGKRRRSSRLSAIKAKQCNFKIPQGEYLKGTKSQTCRSPVDVGHSLTFDISKALEPEQGRRRRSSRLSALKATQCNFKILQGESPLTSLCKKQTSSLSLQKKAKVPSSNDAFGNNKKKLVVSPYTQREHYLNILRILNSGDLRKLQQLPTVGPKTSLVISNFRKLYGTFSSVEELKKVPALSKSYYTRFIKANLLNELNF